MRPSANNSDIKIEEIGTERLSLTDSVPQAREVEAPVVRDIPIVLEKSSVGIEELSQPSPSQPPPPPSPLDSIHQVKWVRMSGEQAEPTPVVTQNENGPCPLLAIMNVLLARGQMSLPPSASVVSSGELMERLGDCILRLHPKDLVDSMQVNYEHNVSDAMSVLGNLATGLDVNTKFTGVSEFEYTKECIVFDLLGIPLYHGWLVDPESESFVAGVIGAQSYNQLVEMVINGASSDDSETAIRASAVEDWLSATASQLTYHGLVELNGRLKDGQLAILFRNNHFSTIRKHRDELFVLVTDCGFVEEKNVIWETLSNVDGDSYFVDAQFHSLPTAAAPASNTSPQQIDKDYELALSLEKQDKEGACPAPAAAASGGNVQWPIYQRNKELSNDEALAWHLQKEEEKLAAEESRRSSNEAASSSPRRGSVAATPCKEDKCHIL